MKTMKGLLIAVIAVLAISCSKKSSQPDPIIGKWEFLKAVEFKNDTAHVKALVGEVRNGIVQFKSNGDFSFSHSLYGKPYFYTTKGTWTNINGQYIIDFKAEFIKNNSDSIDFLNPPKVIFKNSSHVDGMELKLQSDNKVVNGSIEEYFYREYYRTN